MASPRSSFVFLLAVAILLPVAPARAQLVLTEFMAANKTNLVDEDGVFSDWIEIHNPTDAAVNLANWYLTDTASNLTRWRFPNTNLAANGYMVVFASGNNRRVPGQNLHTDFSLQAAGEYLALVHRPATTSLIATEFTPQYPEQYDNVSYGSFAGTDYYFSPATPGAANTANFFFKVKDTKFSHARGFYDQPFNLVITTDTPGATIRYTTNGLPPTATTGTAYTVPIAINGTTTVRAAAFQAGWQPSNVDTLSFIFVADVVLQSANGTAPPGWPASWGANVVDYGMDPDVVNDPAYSATIRDDLKAVPTLSLVLDLNSLFNTSTGIYANPGQDGIDWERPTSAELIYPDGTDGFQIDAGLRIRGGFSRSTSNPKHSFRLFFRDEYGAGKLKFPLFGDDGADEFDGIDMRTAQNYSWSFGGDSRCVFIRDQFNRDAQLAMGRPGERGWFFYLYINGQFWGLYNWDERPEATYGATYFGGSKTNFDVVKVEAGPYTINATDGNLDAWQQLWNLCTAGITEDTYQYVQGNNPDGSRNVNFPVLVDVPNLIDYMLIIFYGGNLDAPISNFLGNNSPNNWFGLRDRTATDGFRFVSHDAEHTLLDVNANRLGPYPAGDTFNKSNPQWVMQKLGAGSAEFRLLVADHAHRHLFNNGVLTPQQATNLFLTRAAEVSRAMVGESARWGDSKTATPLTRDTHWVNAINTIVNNFFPNRSTVLLNQLRAAGYYPSTPAPVFSQHGGIVDAGYSLTMSGTTGTIYYTVDGTDPRLPGGALASGARLYTAPVILNESTLVKSRAYSGSEWSALNEATFFLRQTFTELLVSEVMYHPPDVLDQDGDSYEFIELKNASSQEIELSGVTFASGLKFTFPLGARLSPGALAVLVKDVAAFQGKYPGVPVAGVFTGGLANGGEQIEINHATGTNIVVFTYGDLAPWPTAADGVGFSLVPVLATGNPDPDDPLNWRASTALGGSPGADDPPSSQPRVVINEVLTHTDPPLKDSIELLNLATTNAPIGGWYLTDDLSVPKKFRIPDGTSIPPGGLLVFDEDDFNPTPGVDPSFNLSSYGDEVFLFSADLAGNLTGYSDGFVFDAAQNGVSFGRFANSAGELQYPAQLSLTLPGANTGPRVGPVVINEIHYAPKPGDDEFVELKNITGAAVPLFYSDPQHPQWATNRWQLAGVDFTFPANVTLAANGLLVVTSIDPATFRAKYSVPAGVPVYGPYTGSLQDSGELLELKRPDQTDEISTGLYFTPYYTVDAVRYNDKAPWPIEADGIGPSLERLNSAAYGNDPINWRAAPGLASPGLDNYANRFPRVFAGLDQSLNATQFPLNATLGGSFIDDGLPNPPAGVLVTWSQISGPPGTVFSDVHALNPSLTLPGAGTYTFRLTANDNQLQATDDVAITVTRPPSQVVLLPAGATWKYFDAGADLGIVWVAPGYPDGAWASGPAELGYGDGGEATVVGFIDADPVTEGVQKNATTYFRTTFNVTGSANFTGLTGRLLRDDGAVVYVNGSEAFRQGMPNGAINYQTLATVTVGGADESTFYPSAMPLNLIQDGVNTVAVEVHQNGPTSSDVSFNLQLEATTYPANAAPVVSAGGNQSIDVAGVAYLNGTVTDDGLPLSPGYFTNAWSKVSGPGTVTLASAVSRATQAAFSTTGTYVLRLTAGDGALAATSDVTITVTSGLATWKAQYFNAGELANPAISGDSADPDGDTHTNYQEYITGTHPRDGQSYLKVSPIDHATGSVTLEFNAVAGRAYSILWRDFVESGAWIKLTDVPSAGTTQPVQLIDDTLGSRTQRYYRIVTPPVP